eukprot:TRINITY_DN39145_c0_g1_i1.p1 TRINITY_DN39145_c0_g1~~TRINITY_DN39145_c0_g1_i1.p1  ORF type:complete len:207 (-),score=63.60 TRINITY_DN39145_c0_g1_i1:137-757(-)
MCIRDRYQRRVRGAGHSATCCDWRMGNSASVSEEVLARVQKSTRFSDKEIKRLYERFVALDADKSGQLSREEFLDIPEFALYPLAARVLDAMSEEEEAAPGEEPGLDFEQFAMVVDIFSPAASFESKLDLLFRAFDQDKDGFIGLAELTEIWSLMVHVPMTDEQRVLAAEQALIHGDKDKDGQWSKEEFAQALDNTDLVAKMTLTF